MWITSRGSSTISFRSAEVPKSGSRCGSGIGLRLARGMGDELLRDLLIILDSYWARADGAHRHAGGTGFIEKGGILNRFENACVPGRSELANDSELLVVLGSARVK